jgi:DNA gyrase subunit B
MMIHVIMFDPEFAGPTRTKLHLARIAKLVRSTLNEPLQQYLNSIR